MNYNVDDASAKLIAVQNSIAPMSDAIAQLEHRVMRGEITAKQAQPAKEAFQLAIKGYVDSLSPETEEEAPSGE